PLRPAAGRVVERADGLWLAARGLGIPEGRPRLPAEGRRVQRGLHPELPRPKVGRGLRPRAYAAPDRVPDVLLRVITPAGRQPALSSARPKSHASGGRFVWPRFLF